MYNRYIQNEYGGHTRVPVRPRPAPPTPPPRDDPPPPPPSPPRDDGLFGFTRLLRGLHLKLDSSDLILLLLVFLLARERGDEELLIALGLLLIL